MTMTIMMTMMIRCCTPCPKWISKYFVGARTVHHSSPYPTIDAPRAMTRPRNRATPPERGIGTNTTVSRIPSLRCCDDSRRDVESEWPSAEASRWLCELQVSRITDDCEYLLRSQVSRLVSLCIQWNDGIIFRRYGTVMRKPFCSMKIKREREGEDGRTRQQSNDPTGQITKTSPVGKKLWSWMGSPPYWSTCIDEQLSESVKYYYCDCELPESWTHRQL